MNRKFRENIAEETARPDGQEKTTTPANPARYFDVDLIFRPFTCTNERNEKS